MSTLNYESKIEDVKDEKQYSSKYLSSKEYKVLNIYKQSFIQNKFMELKANLVDLDSALITKCIQGTEQDFYGFMNRAKEFLISAKRTTEKENILLLNLLQDCVFGYYVLTPLLEAKDVSDIKVYDWNHITVKANGERYVTDLSFYSEEDYKKWVERLTRIQRLERNEEFSLQYCTDRKGVKDFYLRIDLQLSYVMSTEKTNLHIRKIPTKKYSWEYLIENGMLDNDMVQYLKDRVASGYGFLISGRGGSGKSTLLNNLIDIIPFSESILVSQESDELYSNTHPQIQFEHTLSVPTADGIKEFSLEDELRLGLLQDIDNFVIGEIKGSEALYCFTTAISTGARFFGTIHSNDALGSVRRLAQCARYVSDYSVETLEEMLSTIPFVLIHMSHFSIDEIVEIKGWDEEHGCLITHKVFQKDTLCQVGTKP